MNQITVMSSNVESVPRSFALSASLIDVIEREIVGRNPVIPNGIPIKVKERQGKKRILIKRQHGKPKYSTLLLTFSQPLTMINHESLP
jgi:hypothetical protein